MGVAPPGYINAAPLLVPGGAQMCSRWKRLGGALLTIVLISVTLVIGYAIWATIVYGRGQTPTKQVLGMVVIDEVSGAPASWGTMFLRGVVIDILLNNFTCAIFGIVSACWIFGGGDRPQRLTDKMTNTLVVNA
jgi:uncharacterized RDD family membrane protein YckC